jgi:pilus assembly protein CpaE
MLSLTAAFTDDTQMIGIGEINDIALYRELTEAGVTDYLVKPVSEKALAAAISRSEEKSKVEAAPTPQASPEEVHKVVVVGARGGVGASTTAVNLAWIFAEEKGMKTALVDLDLEFGTIALSLDLEPTRLAHGHSFSPNAVGVLFETLAHENGCIIVDLPRALYSVRDQVLNEATRVILVTELSLPALRDSIRLLGIIEEAAPKTPITVVANRCKGGQQAMGQGEFQKALGRKVDLTITDESKVFNDAANSGKPVVNQSGRSKAAKSLRSVVDIVNNDASGAEPKAGKKSWLKLGGAKKTKATGKKS